MSQGNFLSVWVAALHFFTVSEEFGGMGMDGEVLEEPLEREGGAAE